MSENILQEADRLTGGDRGADYGHPLDDYTRTAAIWSAILGVDVTPEQAQLCMIGVKISRECNKHKRDNLVDIAGYARTLEMTDNERTKRGDVHPGQGTLNCLVSDCPQHKPRKGSRENPWRVPPNKMLSGTYGRDEGVQVGDYGIGSGGDLYRFEVNRFCDTPAENAWYCA